MANEKADKAKKLKDTLYGLRDDLEYGKKSPSEVLNGLIMIQNKELDPLDQQIRQNVLESAYKKQADEAYNIVLDSKDMSPSDKIKAYDKILDGLGKQYYTQDFKTKVERAKSDSIARRDYIDPLNNVSNTWFGKNQKVGEDGIVRKEKAIIANPTNMSFFTVGNVSKTLDHLEEVMQNIQEQLDDVDPKDLHLYVSKSNIGAYLKRYKDNEGMKNKAMKDDDVFARYNQIMYAIGNLIK